MSVPPAKLQLYEQPQGMVESVIANVEKVLVGKRDAIVKAVIALLAGGHLLLEDVPGVGKTVLVKALARSFDLSFKRIQFTPDLMPADISGVSIYNPRLGEFEFREGPVFANLVLADELNRTPPKTQSALLEAMEERQVTAEGRTCKLPEPFLVLATQNPFECEGTYPLPEAQLDRFFMRIRLGYPELRHEVQMLERFGEQHPLERLRPVLLREELVGIQRQVRLVHVDETIKQYIVHLIAATRKHPDVELGASPRASLALMLAAQSKALIDGRTYVIPDDVKDVFPVVASHRLKLHAEALISGKTGESVVQDIATHVAVPAFRRSAGHPAG